MLNQPEDPKLVMARQLLSKMKLEEEKKLPTFGSTGTLTAADRKRQQKQIKWNVEGMDEFFRRFPPEDLNAPARPQMPQAMMSQYAQAPQMMPQQPMVPPQQMQAPQQRVVQTPMQAPQAGGAPGMQYIPLPQGVSPEQNQMLQQNYAKWIEKMNQDLARAGLAEVSTPRGEANRAVWFQKYVAQNPPPPKPYQTGWVKAEKQA